MAAFTPGPSNHGHSQDIQIRLQLQKVIVVLIFDSLILKMHINYLGARPQLRHAFKQLLNLTNESFFKTGQIGRCRELYKLGRHVVTMRVPLQRF